MDRLKRVTRSGSVPLYVLILLSLASNGSTTATDPGAARFLTRIPFYLSDIPLICLFAIWAVEFIRGGSRSVWFGNLWITVPGLLLFLLSTGSTLWARSSTIANYYSLRLLMMWLLYLYIVSHRVSHRAIALVFVSALAVHSLVAVAQFLLQQPLGLSALGEVAVAETTPGAWLRGYGLGPHPNILGGFLFVALNATVGLAVVGTRRWFTLAALSLNTAGLLATFSRSAWLATLAVSLIGLLAAQRVANWRRVHGKDIGLVVLTVAAVVAVFAVFNWNLLTTRLWLPAIGALTGRQQPGGALEQQVIESRLASQNIAIQLIRRRPLLGVGSGNFILGAYHMLGTSSARYVPVHNTVVMVTAELGLLGGALWTALTISPLILMWTRAPRLAHPVWAAVWTASWLGLSIIGLFDFYLWGWHQGRLLAWLLLGLWANAVLDLPSRPE